MSLLPNYQQAISDLPSVCSSFGGTMQGTNKCIGVNGEVLEVASGAIYYTDPGVDAAQLSGACQESGGTMVNGNECQIGQGADKLSITINGNQVRMAKAGSGGAATTFLVLGVLGFAAYYFLFK